MRRVHSFLLRSTEGYGLFFVCALGVFFFEGGMRGHAWRWTRPLGRGPCGYLSRNLPGVHRIPETWSCVEDCFYGTLLYMLASVRLPSLCGYHASFVYWVEGALGRITGRYNVRLIPPLPLPPSPHVVFLVSQKSQCRIWGVTLWYLWIGRATHREPGNLEVEVFNVGGWLTHGDFAVETTDCCWLIPNTDTHTFSGPE